MHKFSWEIFFTINLHFPKHKITSLVPYTPRDTYIHTYHHIIFLYWF